MSARVSDWMTASPHVVDAQTPLADCAVRLARANVRHLPVLRDLRPIGILSDVDLAGQGVLVGADDLWVPWVTTGPRAAGELAAPVPVLRAGDPVDDAVRVLLAGRHEALLVVDDEGGLVGVFAEHDGMRLALSRLAPGEAARGIASAPPLTVAVDAPAAEAWEMLQSWRVRHALLVDGEVLVGVLSARDLLAEGVHEGRDLLCSEVIRSLEVAAVALDAPAEVALSALVDLRIGCAPLVDERGVPHAVITRSDALRRAVTAAPRET